MPWGCQPVEAPGPASRGGSPDVLVQRAGLAQELRTRFPARAVAWLLGRSRRGMRAHECVWLLWPLPPMCRCLCRRTG
eukprot:12949282-Heterocapsa_arctica.AAC.1